MALQKEQLNDIFKNKVGRNATDFEVGQYSNMSFPQLQKTIDSYKVLQPNTSVVDYLKHTGQDSSLGSRASIANSYGIADYQGTPEQNVELLNNLRKGPPVSRVEAQANNVSEMARNANLNNIPNPNVLTLDDQARAILKYGAGTDAKLGQIGDKGVGMSGVIPNKIQGSIQSATEPEKVVSEQAKMGVPEPKKDIASPYTAPTQKAPVTQTQNFLNTKTTKDGYTFSQLAQALGRQESNNNYKAENKDSGALGKYQIMPKYWFSKIGLNANSDADKAEFLNSPDLQEKLHGLILQDLNSMYKGNTKQIIAHYYGGPNAAKIYGTKAGEGDQTGAITGTKYPTINKYVNEVMARLGDSPITTQDEPITTDTETSAGDISGVGETPPTDKEIKDQKDIEIEDAVTKAKNDYVDIQKKIRDIDKLLKGSYDEKKAQIERTGGIVNQAQLEGLVRNQNAPLVAQRNELAALQATAGDAYKTALQEREYQRQLKKDELDQVRTTQDILNEQKRMDLEEKKFNSLYAPASEVFAGQDVKQGIQDLFEVVRSTKNSATAPLLDRAIKSAKTDQQRLAVLVANSALPSEIKTDIIKRNSALPKLDKAIKLIDEGAKTGLFKGLIEKGVNRFGDTTDPDLVAINQLITSATQPYRSSITGAAWGDQETAEYESLFGSTLDNPEYLKMKLQGLRDIMENTNQTDIYSGLNLADPNAVGELFTKETSQPTSKVVNGVTYTVGQVLKKGGVEYVVNSDFTISKK